MLLTVDIGNTNITLGIFDIRLKNKRTGPKKTWRLSTDTSRTADEYGSKILDLFKYSMIESKAVTAVAIASVVPVLDRVFKEVSVRYFQKKPFFIAGKALSSVKILYHKPAEVGADRIANAVAAYRFFGGPAIVIDFGTATTFDCIGKKGEYLGGIIAPGPAISAESLAQRTAKLPKVDIAKPAHAIGKTTIQSIQSGLYFGYIGLIKEIVKELKREMLGGVKVIATGGLATTIVGEIRGIRAIEPDLTLQGVRLIWEQRRSG